MIEQISVFVVSQAYHALFEINWPMTIIELLSSKQGIRGDKPNVELARQIAESDNAVAVRLLVENLSNKDKNIQSDCIKTLYEIGYMKPALIANEYESFINLLASKNNRLVWGGMIALSTIVDLKPEAVFASLKAIVGAMQKGSVITIDSGVVILAHLNKYDQYSGTIEPLLTEQLWKCPIKQLPMYLEKSLVSINQRNRSIYTMIVEKRKSECETDSQAKRLEKILKQIHKK